MLIAPYGFAMDFGGAIFFTPVRSQCLG